MYPRTFILIIRQYIDTDSAKRLKSKKQQSSLKNRKQKTKDSAIQHQK